MSAAYLTATPPDHDTVWGFLARHEPWVLDTMTDPVLGCLDDQGRGRVFASRQGIDYHAVPSPPAVAQRGIPEVFAFPLHVLHDVYP